MKETVFSKQSSSCGVLFKDSIFTVEQMPPHPSLSLGIRGEG
jgi:hypothetical protein